MKHESSSFTAADMATFLDDYRNHERLQIANRLEAASNRLTDIVERIGPAQDDRGEWTPHQIFAHIASSVKFFGVLAHKVGSGEWREFDLFSAIQQRDTAIEQLADQPVDALLRMIQSDLRRSAEYLRSADAVAMQRRVDLGAGNSLSADEIARLPLCAHLEMHVEQLERALLR